MSSNDLNEQQAVEWLAGFSRDELLRRAAIFREWALNSTNNRARDDAEKIAAIHEYEAKQIEKRRATIPDHSGQFGARVQTSASSETCITNIRPA